MEKILADGLILLGILAAVPPVCLAASPSGGPAAVIRKPASEPFLHRGTELSFPARIDSFEKTMVRVNPLPEYGTDIAYENENGALADVYLYQMQEDFSVHASAAKERIRTVLSENRHIKNVEEIPLEVPEPGMTVPVVCAQYRLLADGENLMTRLYLFPFRSYFVKIRITWPEAFPEEEAAANAFGNEILRLARPEAKPIETQPTPQENHKND